VLLALAISAVAGCGAASTRVSTPQVPQRPTMRATPLTVCPRHQRTTIDIEDCLERHRLKLNARFNKAVIALSPRLDSKSRREFAAGQRSWGRFARNDCDIADREFRGGSIAPVVAGLCYVDVTRARVREVTLLLDGYCVGEVRTGPCARK
jgi:uncharacterized protein YecT (DUF1311 family)